MQQGGFEPNTLSPNPEFGFDAFGFAPPGLTSVGPPSTFGMPTFGQAFGHAVTPNTTAPPSFSFGMPAPQPNSPSTIEKSVQDQINQDPNTMVDPNMQAVNPMPTPFSPVDQPQIDPNMPSLLGYPAPAVVTPITFQNVESIEQDRADPVAPPALAPPSPMPQLSMPPMSIPLALPMERVDPLMEVPPPEMFDRDIEQQVVAPPPAFQQVNDLAPPEGYQQAFAAPMSMAEALNATVAAMNPAMSAPDDTSASTSDDDGGGTGGGIGAEGGGGGAAGAAAAEGGGSPSSGPGGIGSEGGGMGGLGGAGGPGDGGNEGGAAGV